ncbi:MAG TPA: hypothetical protein VGV93_10510 [Acidimicrobiales bacterium]|nr:hypothetical protein [Acidimicrobiales bacterium]
MRARSTWSAGAGAVFTVLAVLAVPGSLGGCSGDQAAMSEAASIELSDQVQEVRSAATAGDVDAARGRLAEIHTKLEALRANGQISADHATRIAAATDDVSRHLALLTTTTVPTPGTAPPPTAPPPRAPDPKDKESREQGEDDKGEEREDDKENGDDGGKEGNDDNGRGRGRN